MKMLMQFRTNFNYMAYKADCLMDICNTHTINFVFRVGFDDSCYVLQDCFSPGQMIFSKKVTCKDLGLLSASPSSFKRAQTNYCVFGWYEITCVYKIVWLRQLLINGFVKRLTQ